MDAMLLYLVTKNHSFSDGNKRIAATLFLWFLNNNGIFETKLNDFKERFANNYRLGSEKFQRAIEEIDHLENMKNG